MDEQELLLGIEQPAVRHLRGVQHARLVDLIRALVARISVKSEARTTNARR